ncbi:MAG TPA: hypothetical protein VEH26_04395 [Chthoniobacterales bacterium]|nr:hypothetical protein [Chthoniobacterales bacterium]
MREEIARSREDLERRIVRVREEADFPRKIRRSVQREPVPWIVGAIAIGLLVTAVVTRKKKIVVDARGGRSKPKGTLVEAGFLLGALRIAATLLKPVVVNLVEKKFGDYVRRERSRSKGF